MWAYPDLWRVLSVGISRLMEGFEDGTEVFQDWVYDRVAQGAVGSLHLGSIICKPT